MPSKLQPSLYEMLTLHFDGELALQEVSEEEQIVLSVLDNLQRILNTRSGSIKHLPDYGLPDSSELLEALPGTAHHLIRTLENTLLKYEPRINRLTISVLPSHTPGQLRYTLEAELKGVGHTRFSTEIAPQGRVLIRHLRQQNHLSKEHL